MTNDDLPPSFQETLHTYRQELDSLDEQLIVLLAKRFSVTQKVGELKARYAAEPLDSAREAAQLQRLTELSRQHGLPASTMQVIFETVTGLVRENHRVIAQQKSAPRP